MSSCKGLFSPLDSDCVYSSTLKKTIKEQQSFQPSEKEATEILTKMEVIVKLTEEQLRLLVDNKSRLEELKVGGMHIEQFLFKILMSSC